MGIYNLRTRKLQLKKIWKKRLRDSSNKLDKVSSRRLKKHIRLYIQGFTLIRKNPDSETKIKN